MLRVQRPLENSNDCEFRGSRLLEGGTGLVFEEEVEEEHRFSMDCRDKRVNE